MIPVDQFVRCGKPVVRRNHVGPMGKVLGFRWQAGYRMAIVRWEGDSLRTHLVDVRALLPATAANLERREKVRTARRQRRLAKRQWQFATSHQPLATSPEDRV